MMGRTGAGGQWFNDVLGNWPTASTSFTTIYFGTGTAAGAYVAKFQGLLQKLRIHLSPQAATSLCQNGILSINCNKWAIQTHYFPFNGFGLQTVPAYYNSQPIDNPPAGDAYLNLPIEPQYQLLIQVQYAYSPVTPFLSVQGAFQITKQG